MRLFFARCAALFWRARAEGELAREIAAHLALLQEEYERRGLSPEDARMAARRAYGGVEQAKEMHREARSFRSIEQLGQDVRYAVRQLRRSPGFAIVAILTLALGIGANTAIFSIINGILWQPVPYANASRLAMVWAYKSLNNGRGAMYPGFPPGAVDRIPGQVPGVEQVGMYEPAQYTLTGGAAPELLGGARVTPGFFTTLSAKPLLGRPILFSDAQPGQDGVTVVSYKLWRDVFGGDPHIVGRAVTLNERGYTIIGVMPRHFDFGLDNARGGQGFWTPLVVAPGHKFDKAFGANIVARLKKGTSFAAVSAQLTAAGPRLWPEAPMASRGFVLTASDILPGLQGLRTPLLILTGVVAFVLLIACVNISALGLALALIGIYGVVAYRVSQRTREIAVRMALGARPRAVLGMVLREGAILGAVGITAGLGGAFALTRLLRSLLFEIKPTDPATFGVVAALIVAVALAACWMPARRAMRVDPMTALRHE